MTFDDLIAPLAITPLADPSANWKRPTAKGKRRSEANVCPGCKGYKAAKYDQCFDCAGLVRCAECGRNYHSSEYDRCFECKRTEV